MKSVIHLVMRRGGTLVAVLALAMASVGVSLAQSPPNPPARFVGTVTIDGAPAPAGTTIEARIGTATCGVATVFMSGSEARYTLDAPAAQPSAAECGTEGASVSFYVGGKAAGQTGSWRNWELNQLNLTVVAPTPVPATPTPRVPVAGNTVGTDYGFSAWWIASLATLAAIGFSGMGWAASRRP